MREKVEHILESAVADDPAVKVFLSDPAEAILSYPELVRVLVAITNGLQAAVVALADEADELRARADGGNSQGHPL
jgi:hypothetical protein